MNYIKNNWKAILIVLVVIFLIWWLFIKKDASGQAIINIGTQSRINCGAYNCLINGVCQSCPKVTSSTTPQVTIG